MLCQCSEVNDVNLNQLTVSFGTRGEVEGVDLECFATTHRGTLYLGLRMPSSDSRDSDSSLSFQKT